MEQEQTNQTDTTQNQSKGTDNQGSSTQLILAYGSSESHQFPSDKEKHSAKPLALTNFFASLDRNILSVACGRLHTVILTTNGEVYTFGSNHDGALGRKGDAKKPAKVDIDFPVDMISAGDSHSIACSSANSAVYQWGTYHGANNTQISRADTPQLIGQDEFKKKKVQKIISGANHTLALADGKVYAWGDPETGILGRVTLSRRKTETTGLKVEGMAVKGAVEDIFTGAYHAFLKKTEKRKKETYTAIFAWGRNDCAQLGLGNTENSHLPVEVMELRDMNVKNITGGEHHTVVLTEEGEVFTFGKNDDGQLGLGKDFEEKEEEEEEAAAEEKPAAEVKTPVKAPAKNTKKGGKGKSAKKTEEKEKKDESAEQAGEGDKEKENGEEKKEEEQTQTQENKEKTATKSKAKGKGRGTDKKETEEESKPAAFKIIRRPQKVELTNVEKIFSGADFNYAITKEHDIYSWGLGNKYVLGTGKEETVYTPEKLDKDLFQGKKVFEVCLGASHVIVLANDKGAAEFELEEEVLKKNDEKLKRQNTTGKKGAAAAGTTGKKGKGKKDEEETGADDVKKDLSKSLEAKDEKEEKMEEDNEEEEEETNQKGKKKSLKRKATDEKPEETVELKKVKKSEDKDDKKSQEKEGKKSAAKDEKKSAEKEETKEETHAMEEEKEEDKGEAAKDEAKAPEAEAMKDEKEEEKTEEKEAPAQEGTAMQEEKEDDKKEEAVQEEKPAEPVQEEKPAEPVQEEKPAEPVQEENAKESAAPAAEGEENKEAVANA